MTRLVQGQEVKVTWEHYFGRNVVKVVATGNYRYRDHMWMYGVEGFSRNGDSLGRQHIPIQHLLPIGREKKRNSKKRCW